MPAKIDLHCHSTVSDGLLSPADLVAHAAKSGVKVLALTDHDDVSGLAAARQAAAEHGIHFVNGVEISATWKKRTLHIVGLKFDAENIALKTALDKVRIGRDERAKEMAVGLAKAGIGGASEGPEAIAKQSILTRRHFAQFLAKHGHANVVKTLVEQFLAKRNPCF